MNRRRLRFDRSMLTGEALRFLIAGAGRTLFSLILYLVLDYFLPYQVAFTIAFVSTVTLAAFVSSKFVFDVRLTWANSAAYAFVYIANYLLSLLLLTVLVNSFGVSSHYAFLLMIPVMLPIGFLLERAALLLFGPRE
jgi:putative flippase GtrA